MPFVPLTTDVDIRQLSKGATLLLPAVSTGNVPQLTVDLLLSTLPHVLLGNFRSAAVLPCAGHNAFEAPAPTKRRKKAAAAAAPPATPLVTAVQVFSVPSLHLIVVQQRAPCVLGRSRAFVDEVVEFARGLDISQLVLLTSSLAFRRNDEDLDAVHPVSFYIDGGSDANAAAASTALTSLLRESLQWNSLHYNALQQDEAPLRLDQLDSAEEFDAPASLASASADADALPAVEPISVPGLGITRQLYELVSSSSTRPAFPTAFLHCYINEGANDRDAIMMAHEVYTMLARQQRQRAQPTNDQPSLVDAHDLVWRMPSSWSALFGNEPDESMYL